MKLLIMFFFLLFSDILQAQPDNLIQKEVDELAQQIIQKGEIKSLAIGVIKNGKTSIYNYGEMSSGASSNINHYEIASITKTFTGLLLAQAVADKRISIEDDIRKYMDGQLPNLEYKGVPITFKNLATHRAGLPYTFPDKPEVFINPDYDKLPFILDSLERGYTRERFFEDLHKVKIDVIPGAQFKYSNVDANLVAYILEKVYSTSFEELLKQYIFKKSDMTNTMLRTNEQSVADLVNGYNTKGIEMPFLGYTARAASGLLSTLPDMLKYMACQLNETDPVIKLSHEPMWKEERGSYSSGYYWQMDVNKGDRKLFQNGGSYGTSSWMDLYPDSHIGIFIITNVSGPNIHGHLSGLSNKIYKILKRK